MSDSIEQKIARIYYDPAGYGSKKETYDDVKKIDKNIKYSDVVDFFEKHVEQKKNLRGMNSFIASHPYEEFQMDLMFLSDLKDKDYSSALLMIDIFTKYCTLIPVKTKQDQDVYNAFVLALEKMKGYPETIYSDNEGSFHSNIINEFYKKHNIRHLITRSHAPVAESTIRTIKRMIYNRIEHQPNKSWHDNDILYPVLLKYNNKMIHSSTKFTPNDATKPQNQLQVKINLELQRKNSRLYPDLKIGDKVKIYKKKEKFDKERVSLWMPEVHIITNITESHGQKFYTVNDFQKPLMRHELLLIKH